MEASQYVHHHFLWPCQVRVRLRKKKHKRRLAHARSGLMSNFGGSKESEYWSFPLPPISPSMPSLTSSASSTDVRALISQVKVLTNGRFLPASLSFAQWRCMWASKEDGWIVFGTLDFFCSAQDNYNMSCFFQIIWKYLNLFPALVSCLYHLPTVMS